MIFIIFFILTDRLDMDFEVSLNIIRLRLCYIELFYQNFTSHHSLSNFSLRHISRTMFTYHFNNLFIICNYLEYIGQFSTSSWSQILFVCQLQKIAKLPEIRKGITPWKWSAFRNLAKTFYDQINSGYEQTSTK